MSIFSVAANFLMAMSRVQKVPVRPIPGNIGYVKIVFGCISQALILDSKGPN
jgi:hypothetical protein